MNTIVRRIIKAISAIVIFFLVDGLGIYEMMETERHNMSPVFIIASLALPYILCYSKYRVIYRLKKEGSGTEESK